MSIPLPDRTPGTATGYSFHLILRQVQPDGLSMPDPAQADTAAGFPDRPQDLHRYTGQTHFHASATVHSGMHALRIPAVL